MNHEEYTIQCQIHEAFEALGIFHFAISNEAVGGGKNAMLRMVRFKRMGLYPGITDIGVVDDNCVIGFIEVKKPGGRLSENQRDFRNFCLQKGYRHGIVYSLDDAINLVKRWGIIS